MALADFLEQGMVGQLLVEPAAAQWTVRQEADAPLVTVRHHPVVHRLAEERVEPVLHGGDGNERLGSAYLVDGDIGETHPADLPRRSQLGQHAHALVKGNIGVGGVELIEVDPVDRQGLERAVARHAQMLGPGVVMPMAVGAHEATLGGHHDLVPRPGPARQRAGNEPLVVPYLALMQAVSVGRVDEGSAAV